MATDGAEAVVSGVKGALYFSSARFLSGLFGFGTTVFLVSQLTPEEYGTASLALTVAGMLSFAGDFGISQSIVRFIAELRAKEGFAEIRKLLLVSGGLLLLSTSSLMSFVIAFSPSIAAPLGIAHGEQTLRLGSLWIGAVVLKGFLLAVLQAFMKFKVLSVLWSLPSLIKFGISLNLVLLGYGADGMVLGFVLADASVCFIALPLTLRLPSGSKGEKTEKSSKQLLGELFAFGKFVLGTQFAHLFLLRTSTLLLGVFGSATLVGYYGAALSLTSSLPNLLGGSVYVTLYPSLSERYLIGDSKAVQYLYRSFMKLVSAVAIPASLGATFLMEPLLTFAFPRYLPVVLVFQVLMIRAGMDAVNGVHSPPSMLAIGRAERRMFIIMSLVGVEAALSFLLIPFFSLIGAMTVAFAVSTIGFILFYTSVQGVIKAKLSIRTYTSLFLAAGVMSFSVWLLVRLIPDALLAILLGFSVGLVIFSTMFLRLGGVRKGEFELLKQILPQNSVTISLMTLLQRIAGLSVK